MTTAKEKFESLEQVFNAIKIDVKFYTEKGNNAAGTRATKGLVELKRIAHATRLAILAEKEMAREQKKQKP